MAKLDTSKFDFHGGTRFRGTYKTSQALFLDYLFNSFGGVSACARLLGIKPQELTNFKAWNGVPLNRAGFISRKLKVTIAALNYDRMFELSGGQVPWEEIVKRYISDRKDVKKILAKKLPKYAKGGEIEE